MSKSIFITSSWINKHAVELLANLLSNTGYNVGSFVSDNDNEYSAIGQNRDVWAQNVDYGEWVYGDEGEKIFKRDMKSIRDADLLILIEPSGRDAWAHAGIAHALGKPVYGLNSRGRKVGLMRRLVIWSKDFEELLGRLPKP